MYNLGHAQADLPQVVELEAYQGIPIQSHRGGMYQCHLTVPGDQFQFTVGHGGGTGSQREHIDKSSTC